VSAARPESAAPVTAIVPLRDGEGGKTRLAEALTPQDRSRLVAVLARHVVEVLVATPEVAEVLVVTRDPEFAGEVVEGLPRVRVVRQPASARGLNGAVDHGRDLAWSGLFEEPVWAASAGTGRHRREPDGAVVAGPVLVVHADLPALGTADVAALVAEPAPVVVAPDGARGGTNALLLRHGPASRVFRFRFGVDSFAAHLAEARERGLDVAVVERPGSQVDLDTPEDWAALPAAVRDRVLAAVPGLARLG